MSGTFVLDGELAAGSKAPGTEDGPTSHYKVYDRLLRYRISVIDVRLPLHAGKSRKVLLDSSNSPSAIYFIHHPTYPHFGISFPPEYARRLWSRAFIRWLVSLTKPGEDTDYQSGAITLAIRYYELDSLQPHGHLILTNVCLRTNRLLQPSRVYFV